jgi:hypothetical protein
LHSRILRTATTHAGLPGLRFHQLPHSYASALICAGESAQTVQVTLGHASAAETLQISGSGPTTTNAPASTSTPRPERPVHRAVRDINRASRTGPWACDQGGKQDEPVLWTAGQWPGTTLLPMIA